MGCCNSSELHDYTACREVARDRFLCYSFPVSVNMNLLRMPLNISVMAAMHRHKLDTLLAWVWGLPVVPLGFQRARA